MPLGSAPSEEEVASYVPPQGVELMRNEKGEISGVIAFEAEWDDGSSTGPDNKRILAAASQIFGIFEISQDGSPNCKAPYSYWQEPIYSQGVLRLHCSPSVPPYGIEQLGRFISLLPGRFKLLGIRSVELVQDSIAPASALQ